MNYYLLLKT